jgi:hypothetical protein
MILETPEIDAAELARRTGWELKPQGACKGDRCVPLRPSDRQPVDARLLAERLGMPLVRDEPSGLWCLGPEAGGRSIVHVQAPDLVLPDLTGTDVHLRSLRGRKVLLVAWASW